MTEEQFNKIMSSPDYFKVSAQKSFEMELPSCKLFRENKEVCKSMRTDKKLCADCWEWAMDALSPSEPPENYSS